MFGFAVGCWRPLPILIQYVPVMLHATAYKLNMALILFNKPLCIFFGIFPKTCSDGSSLTCLALTPRRSSRMRRVELSRTERMEDVLSRSCVMSQWKYTSSRRWRVQTIFHIHFGLPLPLSSFDARVSSSLKRGFNQGSVEQPQSPPRSRHLFCISFRRWSGVGGSSVSLCISSRGNWVKG